MIISKKVIFFLALCIGLHAYAIPKSMGPNIPAHVVFGATCALFSVSFLGKNVVHIYNVVRNYIERENAVAGFGKAAVTSDKEQEQQKKQEESASKILSCFGVSGLLGYMSYINAHEYATKLVFSKKALLLAGAGCVVQGLFKGLGWQHNPLFCTDYRCLKRDEDRPLERVTQDCACGLVWGALGYAMLQGAQNA